jgi:hypothetical protein
VVTGGLLMQALDAGVLFGPLLAFCGWVLAAADAWSLTAGSAVLLLIGRLRGTVRRGDCLLLGAGLAFTLPLIANVADTLIDWATAAQNDPDGWTTRAFEPLPSPFLLMLSAFLTPFGVLGGWVFWRAGVRPAAMPPVDAEVATVFD